MLQFYFFDFTLGAKERKAQKISRALCLFTFVPQKIYASSLVKSGLKTDFLKRDRMGSDILSERYQGKLSGFYRIQGLSTNLGENTPGQRELDGS